MASWSLIFFFFLYDEMELYQASENNQITYTRTQWEFNVLYRYDVIIETDFFYMWVLLRLFFEVEKCVLVIWAYYSVAVKPRENDMI